MSKKVGANKNLHSPILEISAYFPTMLNNTEINLFWINYKLNGLVVSFCHLRSKIVFM